MTSLETFIDVAIWHGDLDRANALLTTDPDLAGGSIFAAAVLGDGRSTTTGDTSAATATA